ncbi:MAG: hypothetical protein EZS28_004661 [Streblomastix strix]|uniref:Protein kinase domain-containing protein n=1 Tax=Streblomastix strix TaxID=222440 RepID=A0A5J4WXJ2_9EUKA|nr:MAG: hypothetical protein EZS28_004661 [Streblomastix strix]
MESDGNQLVTGPIYIGEIVGSTFVTEKLLAAGKTSTVFIARSKGNQEANRVALKMQPIGSEYSTLNNDIAVLNSIESKKQFPKIYRFGTHRQFSFLAMQLLGPTLSDIIKRPMMKKLSISSVAKVGIQGLEALSTLHSAGFVHGNIRLENFAIGYTKETAGNIYLIGFAMSKRINNEDLNIETQNGQKSDNKTNEDRLNSKTKLIQNDLFQLLKMIMALYRGIDEV